MENVKRMPAKLILVDVTPIAFDSDPTRGYLQIKSSQKIIKSGIFGSSVTADNRHCTITGDIDDLRDLALDFKENGVPGKIVITELLRSDLPEEFIAGVKNLDSYLKVAGDSKIVCQKNGEDIFRLYAHCYDLDVEDTYIEHDNSADIRAFAKAKRVADDKKKSPTEAFADVK